jgi:hypothetical protein
MTLETLSALTEINGVKIEKTEQEQTQNFKHFIEVNDKNNTITFKIQNGPTRKNGINGCQIDEIIAIATHILQGLNDKVYSHETNMAIISLTQALLWLRIRTKNRIEKGIEGTDKKH